MQVLRCRSVLRRPTPTSQRSGGRQTARRYCGDGLSEGTVELTDGRAMRYVSGGDHGPLVILESGGGDTAAMWVGVQQILATTCRTLSYDRAGLGGSDPAPAPRTPENIVADTISMLAALGINEPVVLAGHSWGGLLVRLLAQRAPGLASRILLVDPTLLAQVQAGYLRSVRRLYWWLHLVSRLGGRRILLRRFREGRWPEMSGREIDIALVDHWTSADLRTTRREVSEINGARRLLAEVESTPSPVPIRFLVGMRRPEPQRTLVSTECARIAALSACGSVVEVEDAGHSIPQERPRRTASEIRRFALEEIP